MVCNVRRRRVEIVEVEVVLAVKQSCFRYSSAVLAAGFALTLQYVFSFLHGNAPYLFLYPVCFLVGTLLGLGPGIAAIILCALGSIVIRQNALGVSAELDIGVFLVASAGGIYLLDRFLAAQARENGAGRKVAAERLHLPNVADVVPAMLWVAGHDKKANWFSASWLEFTGRELGQELGIGWTRNIHPEDLPRLLHVYEQSFDSRQPFVVQFRLRTRDGNYRWVCSKGAPRFSADGDFAGYVGAVMDIHLQKLTLDSVAQNEQHFRAIFNMAAVGISEIDIRTGRYVRVNRRYEEITGFTQNELQGMVSAGLTHDEDRGQELAAITAVLNNRSDHYELEKRIRRKDGKERWVAVTANLVCDEVGQPYRLLKVTQDITEKKEYQDELRGREELFKTLANSIPQLAWICDAEGVLEWRNERWREYVGLPPVRPSPWEWVEACGESSREECGRKWKESLETHLPLEIEAQFRSTDGNLRWFLVVVVPLLSETGRVKRWVGSATDIDDQRRVRQTLEAAKEEAERANQLKSAFIANMSHEIRTPLGAMLGFTDLLREPGITRTEYRNYLDILTRNGQQLARIINDILDLSKAEAGHMKLEFGEVRPVCAVGEVISLLSVKAKEKNIAIDVSADASTPQRIESDYGRLKQILMNVIGNAVKFTPAGSVKVRLSGLREGGKDLLVVDVTDTGIGIPKDQLENVFNLFVQGDDSMTRKYGGTGLGLPLARRLARALGGDVVVLSSRPGSGTRMRITIEARKPVPSTMEEILSDSGERSRIDLSNTRILLVEDSVDNQQLIWLYLTKAGAAVDIADNGLEGVVKARTGDYDLILMDVQMPYMDGYTATQRIREDGYKKPIIALTAHAMKEFRVKSLDVGCNDHLAKPIERERLIETIARHLTA